MKRLQFSVLTGVFSAALLAVTIQFGGSGGCGSGGGGGGTNATTRAMTATMDANSLVGLTIRKRSESNAAGLAIKVKNQTLSCSEVDLCCTGNNGSVTVATKSGCDYTVDLPLESFCYCGLFTGDDADGDGCPDDYVGSFGCSEKGYSGAIPVFPDSDGSTDAIALGNSDLQGAKVVAQNDPCDQVDSDQDGTDDLSDTDDDNDNVLDEEDFVCGGGCVNADEIDSDNNDIPDVYEDIWDDQADADSDDVPDSCDGDIIGDSCDDDAEDTNGDCWDDIFESFFEDGDDDGVFFDFDCDDDDENITTECYEEVGDFCALDLDEDGVDICNDCNDLDPNNDLSIDDGCDVTCDLGSNAECSEDFQCQLFAEDEEVEGNPICSAGSVSCMTCMDGCCTVMP